jgi:hypothetical protein
MNRSGPRSNHLVFHFCPHLFPRLILGRMEDEDGDDGSQSRRVFTGLKAARGQTFQSGAWRWRQVTMVANHAESSLG